MALGGLGVFLAGVQDTKHLGGRFSNALSPALFHQTIQPSHSFGVGKRGLIAIYGLLHFGTKPTIGAVCLLLSTQGFSVLGVPNAHRDA